MEIFFSEFFAGRFLNSIVVLVLSLTSLFLALTILRSSLSDRISIDFGYFWLFIGLAWLASSFRQLFSALNLLELDQLFFSFTQSFVLVSGMFLAPYLFAITHKQKILVYIIRIIFIGIGLIGILFMFIWESIPASATEYATEYIPNAVTMAAFAFLTPLLLVLACYQSIRMYRALQLQKVRLDEFLAPFSIALYLTFSLFDITGLIGNWLIIAFRLVFLVAFILAYASVTRLIAHNEEIAFRSQKSKVIVI